MPAVATADNRRPVPAHLRGARVMVLDGSALNRSILLEQLVAWGFDACGAEDVATARMILDAADDMGVPVDAVLVDYHMGDGLALDFCQALRGERGFHAPAIILLAALDQTDQRLIETLQADAQVAKPVRANILRNTVIEVLRSRHNRHRDTDLRGEGAGGKRIGASSVVSTRSPPKPAEEAPPERVRIIVAEDNDVNAYVFSQILEAAGYAYRLAADGEEAIRLWQEYHPDVILMDISMPVMDGLEATRRIRHMERVADMPPVAIIAVTAHDTQSGRELCLSHGMDDYLAKPISPEALEEKLARWLKMPEAAFRPA